MFIASRLLSRSLTKYSPLYLSDMLKRRQQRLFYLEALYLCIYLHINFYTAQAEENEPAAELQLPKYFRADEGKISMREKKRLPNPLLDERGGAMAL